MTKLIVSTGLLLLSLSFTTAQTLFVKSGAAGDGYSWESPMGNLQTALRVAAQGTQIWVAKGTYFPSDCENCSPKDRATAFEITSGVQVFGGFAGYEGSLEERNWKANPTILSGNIGREDHLDNSQTIVYFENANENTTLDGFFIIEGYANAEGNPGSADRGGAGIFNVCTASNGISNPTISNCRFMDNLAWEGAAIFNHSQSGRATATISECAFIRNKATLAGGAILDNNIGSTTHSKVSNSRFIMNEAQFGAGYFTNKTDLSGAIFQDCHFIKNKSEKGPAGYLLNADGNEHWFGEGCTFKGNETKDGDDVYLTAQTILPDTKKMLVKMGDL